MSRTIGVGIIGAGNIGQVHALALDGIPGARLVAVADVNVTAAAVLAETYGAQPYGDYCQMLSHRDLSLVSICTPSGLHLPAALACARAGKHIFCEKPLEVTTARIDRMIATAEKFGVSVAGVFQSRLSPAATQLKAAVDQHRFGRLCYGNANVKWYRDRDYYQKVPWRGTRKLDGGGALMNQSIHQIDLLRWLMGPVEKLCALTDNLGHAGLIEAEDTATVMLKFRSGAQGTIIGSTALWPGQPARVEIFGTEGTAAIEDGVLKLWQFKTRQRGDEAILAAIEGGNQQSALGTAASDPIKGLKAEGHRLELAAYIEAILAGKPFWLDGRECRKAVYLITQAYRSAGSRRWVKCQEDI